MRGPNRYEACCLAMLIATLRFDAALAAPTRVVVELFTSQGCSSCPPADAFAGQLTTIPAVLVLSFHVDYWDDLGWKDPFSSKASTDRQYGYREALKERSVFTPQLIVNGTQSVAGAQVTAVQQAITAGSQESLPIKAVLEKRPDGGFNLTLGGPELRADVWAIEYVRHSLTKIRAGENGGRSLETFNDVTRIRRIGEYKPGSLELPPVTGHADGLAILVQAPHSGPILAAAAY